MQYYDTDPHALSCAPHEKLYQIELGARTGC